MPKRELCRLLEIHFPSKITESVQAHFPSTRVFFDTGGITSTVWLKMTTPIAFKITEISPADFVSEARKIPVDNAHCVALNKAWLTPAIFLEWARRGLAENDEYGLSNGLTYAKRAACCRIDRLIRNYHLQVFNRAFYPEKSKALENVGIEVPSVIQELIINPRNDLEHAYISPSRIEVRHAIEIASLFLTATNSVENEEAFIAFNSKMQYSAGIGKSGEYAKFNGWSKGSMLFIDVFDTPEAVKIIDGQAGDIHYTKLADFSRSEAVELAKIFHTHYSEKNRGKDGLTPFIYSELKSQAGI